MSAPMYTDTCPRCGHFLHFYGAVLTCVRCDARFPEHPRSVAMLALEAEQKAATKPPVPFTPPTIETPTDPRVLAIEKAIDTLSSKRK